MLLAFFVLRAFGGIAVWGIVAVPRAKTTTQSQRVMPVGGIVVLIATLAAWVILL